MPGGFLQMKAVWGELNVKALKRAHLGEKQRQGTGGVEGESTAPALLRQTNEINQVWLEIKTTTTTTKNICVTTGGVHLVCVIH